MVTIDRAIELARAHLAHAYREETRGQLSVPDSDVSQLYGEIVSAKLDGITNSKPRRWTVMFDMKFHHPDSEISATDTIVYVDADTGEAEIFWPPSARLGNAKQDDPRLVEFGGFSPETPTKTRSGRLSQLFALFSKGNRHEPSS